MAGPSLLFGSSSFLGSRSMVSFKDVNGGNKSFFCAFDHGENEEYELEEYVFHQPDKKRRLTAEQIEFLERSFEAENKLEPERKIQLAKDLGLKPRQIAIWFQNRRARWRTKNLEKDYELLKASYDSLKANYDYLVREKEALKAEVDHLSETLMLKDNEVDSMICNGEGLLLEASPKEPVVADSVSLRNPSEALAMALEHDDLSSAKSDVLDPNIILAYPGPPANSTYFSFSVEDHGFSLWSS